MSDTVRGTIDVHTRGFGFVEWTEDGSRRSAFVPPPAPSRSSAVPLPADSSTGAVRAAASAGSSAG